MHYLHGMNAAYYEQFQHPIFIKQVPDPAPAAGDVVIQVKATGLCRSDWHGWMGHDADIHLPHVPGHEFAGEVVETGRDVRHWKRGDRVTVPFCVGCGTCPQCRAGNQQICDNYFQPGFTAWGSFAEFVNVRFADHNLVRLPEDIAYPTAAVLGCRFITSLRGVVEQGRLQGGEWVAVYGCGGVGLSAVMIAVALGANVIAVDIDDGKLDFAQKLGAIAALHAGKIAGIPEAIHDLTHGGVHLSIDALGSRQTCRNSIFCLRKRGRHVQLGLMAGQDADPSIPMGAVIAKELEIIGSHGMQAHRYPRMLDMITAGKLQPELLIGKTVTLEEGAKELMELNSFKNTGVTVIERFNSL
jgi:alcohol dehydrogenase